MMLMIVIYAVVSLGLEVMTRQADYGRPGTRHFIRQWQLVHAEFYTRDLGGKQIKI